MTTQQVSERPSIEPRWLFPSLDVLLTLLAFVLAFIMRYQLQLFRPVFDPGRADLLPYLPFAAIFSALLVLSYQGSGLYKNIRGRAWMEEVSLITNGVTNATVILLALYFIFQPAVTSRLMLVYVAALTVILLSAARLIRRLVLAYLRERGIGVQRVALIGMGEVGQSVLRAMIARPELGYKPVIFLDDDADRNQASLGRVRGLGLPELIGQVIRENQIDLVVITLRWTDHERIMRLVRDSQLSSAEVRVVPDVFQLNLRQVQVENLDGIPLLGVNGHKDFKGTNRLFKRALDMGLIVLTAPLWLSLYALVALAIRLEGPGPVLYRQRRIGENGQPFWMYKFRSMVPDADQFHAKLVEQSGEDPRHPKLRDDPRITRVGRLIRRTSLDELPNIFNVLRGQMSLVGPRPPTPDEVELYESWHMQRLKIIPGITGLWQVSGRSDVPFEEMCLLDIYYIENWSLALDLQILLRTLPRVILRRGAY